MAAYLPGSNVQAETIQTLHLMNPGYSACADMAPVPNDGNNSQHQHPFLGYSLPPLLSHTQQPSLPGMYTPQQSPSGAFSSRISPYTWTNSTTTNEVPSISSNEATPLTHVFASKYASMTPELQYSHFNMGRPAIHEGATPGSNMSKALSLSLLPGHHPAGMPYYTGMQSGALAAIPDLTYVVGDKSGFKGDGFPNMAYATHFRSSSADGTLGTTLHNYMNDNHVHAHAQPEVSSAGGFFTGSKYLKAVQHLLNEVVSVEEAIKKSSLPTKHVKKESWSVHNSQGDTSGLMRGMAEAGMAGKEGMAWGLTIAKSASCPDIASSLAMELAPQARQELQMKKARLMAMLEEVDRRYKVYHSQMQAIVSLFESAAGTGSARCYTALALQTISRHFRCLRDAIAGQVRVAGKGLGEEEQLSQHRALQQLHLMQQHAWRPQRGLPERAVSVLRAWLFEHFLHPYPKDSDKVLLAKQTGLTRNQVSNWFINARVRLWKPMVEEMYQEESKEADMPTNERLNDIEEEEGELRVRSAVQRDSHRGIDPNLLGNLSTDHGTDEGSEEETRVLGRLTTSIVQNPLAEATAIVDSRFPPHEWQGAKKARNSMESTFAARAEVYPNIHGEDEKQNFVALRGVETQSYGPYLTNVGDTRGNAPSILGGNAVSLTLGLQRSEPLEAQHQQHQQQHLFFHHLQEPGYGHGHDVAQHVSHQLPDGFLERGNVDPVRTSQNYYTSIAATNLSSNSLEAMFSTQTSHPK
eukprot:c13994_g1_i1 orf=357-2609(+)